MKIGIMQPYFFPYLGYFQLISIVNKYVIYDDVNYIKGGWINRNNILLNKQKYLFTIALEQSSPNKLVNEIKIKDDFIKFRKTIMQAYSKAPFFEDTIKLINLILSHDDRLLSGFTANSIIKISRHLGIDTEFLISSEIKKNNLLKNQDKVINICKLLMADEYINAIGGIELYNKNDFEMNKITLKFLKTTSINYNQFNNLFVPWLSIIDVMMFNSVGDIRKMLNNYELV